MPHDHDPPHIKLYDWPNVPQRAKDLAALNGMDGMLAVAIIPDIFDDIDHLLPGKRRHYVTDDDEITYCFIH